MTVSDFLDGIAGTDSSSPEDARTAEAQVESLRAAIERLTPKQRFVIERAWGITDGVEYSFREIAALMGVTYNAVFKHYHAGMERLGWSVSGVMCEEQPDFSVRPEA